jgi:hypothetical protein
MRRALPLLFAAAVSIGAVTFVLARGEPEDSYFDRVPSYRPGSPEFGETFNNWRVIHEHCVRNEPPADCMDSFALRLDRFIRDCFRQIEHGLCSEELEWVADQHGWDLPPSDRSWRLRSDYGADGYDDLFRAYDCSPATSSCLVNHAYVLRRILAICEELFTEEPCAQMLADAKAAARFGPYAGGDLQSANLR